MKKPLIGVVLDSIDKGDYSIYPYYVMRQQYFDAVSKAGGVPIGLDLNSENIETYLDVCDGLVLPGGDYDIPPTMYGETAVHESVVTKESRLQYDIELTKKFLEADKPVLGICAGQQLLAVMLGGTLVQDIATEVPEALSHYEALRDEPAHKITLKEGSKLMEITAKDTMMVNSHHHQSVKTVGEDMLISAVSEDGVIEGIESTTHSFCIGVVWHPEFLIDEGELKLFSALVGACKK